MKNLGVSVILVAVWTFQFMPFICCMNQPKNKDVGLSERQILDQLKLFSEMYVNKDFKGISEKTYRDDAYLVPPAVGIIHTKAGIVAFYTRLASQGVKQLPVYRGFFDIYGDTIINVAPVDANTGEGDLIEKEKNIMIWRRDPTSRDWKILFDMWNKER